MTAHRESWAARSRRWMRRHRTLVSTAVGVLLVALVGLTVGLLIVSEAERKETAARKTAEAQKEEARFNQYVAEMNLVQRAYEADHFDQVRELLAAQVPREAGVTDFRNFEWHYWQSMARRELLALKGHRGTIADIAFSPEGQWLASASIDKTVRLWDAGSGKELLTLKNSANSPAARVGFSRDGRRLATVGWDEKVTIWDSATGKELLSSEGHCATFSPDSRRLALASGTVVRVLDLATGKELFAAKGDHFSFSNVVFSPDGRRLALGVKGSGTSGGTVRVVDAATGKELLTLKGHAHYLAPDVIFSPDGRRLASSGAEGTVRLWDAATGQERAVLNLRRGGTIRIISPRTGRELSTLKEITSASEINVLDHASGTASMVFSPDSRRLATFGSDRSVRLWDAASGKELLSITGRSATIQGAAFSPDGRQLATVGEGTVQLWDTVTSRELFAFTGQSDALPGRPQTVVFSPDGRRLAAAGPHRTVRVWDVASGPTRLSLSGSQCVAFSPNGQQLAGGGTVQVSDAVTGQIVLTLHGPKGLVWSNSVAFSPDGQRLATANLDHTVHIWSLPAGKDLLACKGHTDGVWTVAFSPDGRRLASAGLDPTLRVWDAATGQELLTCKGHTAGVWTVAFSPDGRRLASASYDGTVRVWDAADGQELQTLKGHTGAVWGVAFSPDSQRLASAGADQTVRVWDAATGEELRTLKGHTDVVQGVAFSPDGRRIASASWDTTVRLWDGASGRELLVLKGHKSTVLGVAFSPDGQRLASVDVSGALIWESAPVPDELWRRRLLVPRVFALWMKLLLREEVLAALRADPTLSEAERDFALHLARTIQPLAPISARQLNDVAWQVLKSPDASKDEYVRALHQAEAGTRLAPEDGFVLNTLGVAQYRLGRHAEALATLTKAEKLNAATKGTQPVDLAFLAMTLHQLGKKDQAKATLDRLRQFMRQPHRDNNRVNNWANDDTGAAASLYECRSLLEGEYRIPGVLEGERLKVLRKSSEFELGSQQMSLFPSSQWSGEAHLLAHPPKGGGWVDLELPVSGPGRHEVIVYLTKAPDCGIVQFRLDGKALGQPIDCFEPEIVMATGPLSLGVVELKKGSATLRVEAVGSNPRSVGKRTLWGLDCILLKPMTP